MGSHLLAISMYTSPKRGDHAVGARQCDCADFIRRKVTQERVRCEVCGQISIHTSPKRGDVRGGLVGRVLQNFNPHLPEER